MSMKAILTARTVYDLKIGSITYKAMEPDGELEGMVCLRSMAGTVVIDDPDKFSGGFVEALLGKECPREVDIIKITPSMIPKELLTKEPAQ